MKKILKSKIFWILIIILIIILFIWLFSANKTPSHIPSNAEKTTVNGESMYPLIKDKSSVYVVPIDEKKENVKLTKENIVIYDYKGTTNKVIKKVKAIDKDEVELKGNKLYVNGYPIKNSEGRVYEFKSKALKMLSLYIKDKHIPKDSVFIFADNLDLEDVIDSRTFGAVSKRDITGIVYTK